MTSKFKPYWGRILSVAAAIAFIAAGIANMETVGDFIGKHNPFFMRASADGLHKKMDAERKRDRIDILTNTTTRVQSQLYRAQREKDYLDSTNATAGRTRSLTEHIRTLQKDYRRANERLEALEK